MSGGIRTMPMQRRAYATLSRVLGAAVTLYNDPNVGRDRMTTQMVADRAGVSIGTVYRYFEDRILLLDAIAPDRDQSPIPAGLRPNALALGKQRRSAAA